jgi:hypothetical protein
MLQYTATLFVGGQEQKPRHRHAPTEFLYGMAIANENQPPGCVSEQWLITAMCGLRSGRACALSRGVNYSAAMCCN